MDKNIGTADRIIRVIIGIALAVLLFLPIGGWRWLGLIAIIPLLTAFVRWCPLYRIFGIRTCPAS